ncbi:hypothetical protein EDC04DRAFT_2892493 [Pisolithus marmoratus]|nr:hypothetical protein EDC04DRAFT_2892493 [Pisolithus marmoratus]
MPQTLAHLVILLPTTHLSPSPLPHSSRPSNLSPNPQHLSLNPRNLPLNPQNLSLDPQHLSNPLLLSILLVGASPHLQHSNVNQPTKNASQRLVTCGPQDTVQLIASEYQPIAPASNFWQVHSLLAYLQLSGLSESDSQKFLDLLFPDEVVFRPISMGELFKNKPNFFSMQEVFKNFIEKGLYNKAEQHWTGAPNLSATAITGCENSLADFFNSVIRCISLACGMVRPGRTWTADSTTCPLAGGGMVRKPDMACWLAPGSEFDWRHLATFTEVKNCGGTDKEKLSFIETAGKASCLLYAQDRSLSTCGYDINVQPCDFVHILIGITTASNEVLGFDTSIAWEWQQHNGEAVGIKSLDIHVGSIDLAIELNRPVGDLITKFSYLGELLVAFLDYVVGDLFNLFLASATQRSDHKEFMEKVPSLSMEAQVELCKRIAKLKWQGVLGDWGYAVPIIRHTTTANPTEVADTASPPTPPVKMLSPTANKTANCVYIVPASLQNAEPHLIPISDLSRDHNIVLAMGSQSEIESDLHQTIDMSPLYCTMLAQLVMAGARQPVVHQPLHDLKSLFYVLVGICVLLDSLFNLKSGKDLTQCFDKYFNTFEPSMLKMITIQSDIMWRPFILDHILPYFKPIISLLLHLCDAVIVPLFFDDHGNISCRAVFTHDMFIANIIETLSHLGPDAWVPVTQDNNNKNYSDPEMKVKDELDEDGLVQCGRSPP